MLPHAAVEAAGAQATGFEICVRSRRGRGRCGRAFRSAPCRHGRCGRRGGRGSRRDNPRLRLRVTSKARQVVVIAIVWHDTPPWFGAGGNTRRPVIWQRGCAMSSLSPVAAGRKLSQTVEKAALVAWTTLSHTLSKRSRPPSARCSPDGAADVAAFGPACSRPWHFTQFAGGALRRRR
jgi:hypothetical protein